MNCPEPGIYADVDEAVYRAWPALNQSRLRPFKDSDAHAHYEYMNPSESPDKDLGNAIHSMLLEGDDALDARYAVRPVGIDRRTKAGKLTWAQFVAENGGKIILETPDVLDQLTGIRDSIRANERAFRLLTGPGPTELSAVWDGPHGMRCKMRVDKLTEDDGWPTVVEVKTTKGKATPFGFRRAVEDFSYHIQQAFYLDGLNSLYPMERKFLFIVIEKKPPYGVRVCELDPIYEELGRIEYRAYAGRWKRCIESNHWPGYPSDVAHIEAPKWISDRLALLDSEGMGE